MKIRAFRDADAPRLAEWLDALAPAEEVYTAELLVHQRRRLPRRRRPLWLVAEADGDIVGLARDEAQIFGFRPGLRRIWVGVLPDFRRRGIGSELWQRVEEHARQLGGRTLRSWAIGENSDGQRFLLARGFTRVLRELQSFVDPASVDTAESERVIADATERGLRVVTLRTVLPRMEAELRRLFLGADRDVPGRVAPRPVAASTFRSVILRHPLLDLDCSTVVFYDNEPVALSWLKGNRTVGRYGVEFTGTAPEWRGRGYAFLAKLAALRLAARAGVRWVGTANAEDNAPMLAVNRRLGHQQLPDLLYYERELETPEEPTAR